MAQERQKGVWRLDSAAESKLRQLGERADKFNMMQRAEAIIAKWRPDPAISGAAAELRTAIAARADWLAGRQLATIQAPDSVTPSPEMMMALRKDADRAIGRSPIQTAERRVHTARTRAARHRRL